MMQPETPESWSPAEAHRQYLRQAGWTSVIRNQLYRRANLLASRSVLDVGCGTGAITTELARRSRGFVVGIDVDQAALSVARAQGGNALYLHADAHALPFAARSFDVVHCHFFLLWATEPVTALAEMRRVCREGGHILVCAEPDYGGRVDYPPEVAIGRWLSEGLRRQGADPNIGRKLAALFAEVGLEAELGVIASVWSAARYLQEMDDEWRLCSLQAQGLVDEDALRQMRTVDERAAREGKRLSFLPLFYATARLRQADGGP